MAQENTFTDCQVLVRFQHGLCPSFSKYHPRHYNNSVSDVDSGDGVSQSESVLQARLGQQRVVAGAGGAEVSSEKGEIQLYGSICHTKLLVMRGKKKQKKTFDILIP